MKRRQKRSYKEISMKGKVSIPGDTAHADKVFGPFPSPARLPSLQWGRKIHHKLTSIVTASDLLEATHLPTSTTWASSNHSTLVSTYPLLSIEIYSLLSPSKGLGT